MQIILSTPGRGPAPQHVRSPFVFQAYSQALCTAILETISQPPILVLGSTERRGHFLVQPGSRRSSRSSVPPFSLNDLQALCIPVLDTILAATDPSATRAKNMSKNTCGA